jgi:hypothetical protein
MKILSLFFALAAALPTVAPAQTDERRARWEAAEADQRRFLHNQFTRVGFEPIELVRARGRDVRRLIIEQPYIGPRVPGIEFERHPDGRVTLRLQYPEWSSEPSEIDPSAWSSLTARDEAVFVQPEYVPPPPPTTPAPPPPPPPPPCHAWHAWLEADADRVIGWSGCSDVHPERRDYVIRMIELAMATRPSCSFDAGAPFAPFVTCFRMTNRLDDPKIDEAYSALVTEYERGRGSDLLLEARRAVHRQDLTIGSEGWVQARDAVGRLIEHHEAQRERLRRLQQLAGAHAYSASAGDRYKMRQTIQGWSQFLDSSERNLVEVLRALAWAGQANPRN